MLYCIFVPGGESQQIKTHQLSSGLIFAVGKNQIVSLLLGGVVTLDLAFSLAALVLMIWEQDIILLAPDRQEVGT